jgi:hypothetical protein
MFKEKIALFHLIFQILFVIKKMQTIDFLLLICYNVYTLIFKYFDLG